MSRKLTSAIWFCLALAMLLAALSPLFACGGFQCTNPTSVSAGVSPSVNCLGATYVQGTVTIGASAHDADGLNKIEIYLDGQLVQTCVLSGGPKDGSCSYSWNTNNSSEGQHSYYAKAYDRCNNVTTSPTYYARVDRTNPTVSLTAPANGACVSGTITVSASASDNFAVKEVRFYRDGGVLIGTDTTSPYSISWDTTTVADGSHTLYAVAYDCLDHTGTSQTITVKVNNNPPTVSITQPANNATFCQGDQVLVKASASSGVGIDRVVFTAGSSSIGTDTAPPDCDPDYCATWDTSGATPGNYTITATAYDTCGGSSSDSITVTINAVYEPVVEIIEPGAGPIGGITPIRVRVSSLGAPSSLLLKRHEDTTEHDWQWVTVWNGAPPTPESSETDPNSGVVTSVYRFDWNTLADHNGGHLLHAEATSSGPCAGYTGTDEATTQVKNLVISGAPEVLVWNCKDKPQLDIVLEDAISQTTEVTLRIYDSFQTQLRTETFSWLPGSHSYSWDGKDEDGSILDAGIYIYTLEASQTTQGDQDSDINGIVLSAHAEIPEEGPETGITQIPVDFSISLPGSDARVDVYGPAGDTTQPWQGTIPIPANQTVYFPAFGYDLVGMPPGEVVFVVTAYADESATDRAHRNRRMLQHNDRHRKGEHMLVLDPGHGIGSDVRGAPGADDSDSIDEEGIVLAVALEVESLFRARFEKSTQVRAVVELTRRDSTGLRNSKRWQIAHNKYHEWLKHLNIDDTPKAPGIHTVMHETHWKQVPFFGAISIHCSPGGDSGLPFEYRYPETPEFEGEYGQPLANYIFDRFSGDNSIPYLNLYRLESHADKGFFICRKELPAGILAEIGAIGRPGIGWGEVHRDWEVWTWYSDSTLAAHLFDGVIDRIHTLPSH